MPIPYEITSLQTLAEVILIALLGTTLLYLKRLQQNLRLLRRDRLELELLLRNFDEGTRHAETGITQLREAASGVGREITQQMAIATQLKFDLAELIGQGQVLVARLSAPSKLQDETGTTSAQTSCLVSSSMDQGFPRVRSQAERDLLQALRVAR